MKKEYLILIAIILVLSTYLLFNKENKDHFPLPSIIKMSPDKITGLEIIKKEGAIRLGKKDKTWTILDLNRPADQTAIGNMLDALRDLKISALVSEKKDVKRYELDKEKQIHVKVSEGKSPIFEFSMGKTAPTFNHTFVMIADDTNIYHAKGSFRNYFDKSEADLRDKKVMSFKEKSIKEITLEKEGKKKAFVAREAKEKDKEPVIVWHSGDDSTVDKQNLTDLLSALSSLECDSFLPENEKSKLEKQSPYCRIIVRNDQELSLGLAKKEGEETLSGISSMNPDAFVLSKFNAEDIIEKVDALLGIEKPEKEEQDQQ